MGNGGKKKKGHQGTGIKDIWTKPKGVGSRGGREWRQLYLNNNKKCNFFKSRGLITKVGRGRSSG